MSDSYRLNSYRYWSNTWRLLPIGYRASFSRAETGHWYGGDVTHKGAKCFTCKAKLRLVWDINILDPTLPEMVRLLFPGISRLPLLYCFNCPQTTTYQVASDTRIKCLDPAGHAGGDETPFTAETAVPAVLPRKPIALRRINSVIDGILSIAHELGFDVLDKAAQKLLLKFLDKDMSMSWGLGMSQFGGEPTFLQGHWEIICPNCADKSRDFAFIMKELAVVEEDCAAGFKWACAPLVYHVCRHCRTIQGDFQCD
ncbi:MAG: hypothetical protein ACKVP0_01070 [Pirellulaceae bacterium]